MASANPSDVSVAGNDPADERDEYIIDSRDIGDIDDGEKYILKHVAKYKEDTDVHQALTFHGIINALNLPSFGNDKFANLTYHNKKKNLPYNDYYELLAAAQQLDHTLGKRGLKKKRSAYLTSL